MTTIGLAILWLACLTLTVAVVRDRDRDRRIEATIVLGGWALVGATILIVMVRP